MHPHRIACVLGVPAGADSAGDAAGQAALAAQWFAALGFTMPYGVNTSDHILDVASGSSFLLPFPPPSMRPLLGAGSIVTRVYPCIPQAR